MTRWEYYCIPTAGHSDLLALIDVANELGADGWEAFAVCYSPHDDVVIWFKRPLPEPVDVGQEMADVASSPFSGTAIFPRMMRL